MAEPTIELVLAQVNELYSNPDNTKKQQASAYLEQVRHSPFAWSIADAILHGDYSKEAWYFAANTIRSKIQHSFLELPIDTHEALRNSLLSHLQRFGSSNVPNVFVQLSVAVVDFALYMESWKNPATDLIQNFASQPLLLLDVLTAFPEEIFNRHLKIDSARRLDFEKELAGDCPQVIQFCEHLLQNVQETSSLSKTFKCLSGFLRFAGPHGVHFASSFLLPASFQALANPELAEYAGDTICEAIFLSKRSDSETVLRPLLLEHIATLREPLRQCIQSGDEDLGFIFTSIFTDLATSCLEAIVDSPEENIQYARDVLEITSHPEVDVVQRTFHFWYALADVIEEAEEAFPNKPEQFAPLYISVFRNVTQHAQCDGTMKGLLDEKAPLAEYRKKLANLLIETCFIPTSTAVFNTLLTELWGEAQPEWQHIERVFFALRVLARNLNPADDKWGPQIMYFVNSLPSETAMQLRLTVVELLGELGPWLKEHSDFLEQVLSRLFAEIQVPELLKPSVSAIRTLGELCRAELSPHFAQLLEVIRYSEAAHFPSDDIVKLYEAASLVQAHFPVEDLYNSINQLCSPLHAQLHDSLTNAESTVNITKVLKKLATIFHYTNPPRDRVAAFHPCLKAAQDTWSLLSVALTKYQNDADKIESLNNCMKWMIRCVKSALAAEISDIIVLEGNLFATFRHSSCVYIAGIIMEVFLNNDDLVSGLFGVLEQYVQTTFAMVTSFQDMVDHPEIIEDFVRLLIEVLRERSVMFLRSNMAESCFQLGSMATLLANTRANSNVMDFLYAFVAVVRKHKEDPEGPELEQIVSGVLSRNGQALTDNLLAAVTGGLPSHMLGDVGDVLWEMRSFHHESLVAWVHASPNLANMQPHLVPDRTKANFLTVIEREDKKEVFKSTVAEMSRFFA